MKFNNLIATQEEYLNSIKKLFPKGEYWDKQFADEDSDLSLWVKSKAENLMKFKARFEDLLTESNPQTAITTIEAWEQTLLGTSNPHLTLPIRRALFSTKRRGFVNLNILKNIAEIYSAKIKRVYYPYRSAFFGHSKFGINRMCNLASFSLIFIEVKMDDQALKFDFENEITNTILANNIVKFFYNSPAVVKSIEDLSTKMSIILKPITPFKFATYRFSYFGLSRISNPQSLGEFVFVYINSFCLPYQRQELIQKLGSLFSNKKIYLIYGGVLYGRNVS